MNDTVRADVVSSAVDGLPLAISARGLAKKFGDVRAVDGLDLDVPRGMIFAFALLIAIGFGMGWIFIVLGLLISTPMTVMTFGFTFLFPLVFASNIMVDPATMPGWLRTFVEVNPISFMSTAMRG